jgi:hypothetical protein
VQMLHKYTESKNHEQSLIPISSIGFALTNDERSLKAPDESPRERLSQQKSNTR